MRFLLLLISLLELRRNLQSLVELYILCQCVTPMVVLHLRHPRVAVPGLPTRVHVPLKI